MNKLKIYTDIDGTLINSIKKITELYDEDFHLYKNYKKVHWTDINTWGFTELPLANNDIILDYFSDFRFFKKLEFMDNAKEVLTELSYDYEIFAPTFGTRQNIRFKEDFLHNNLPFVKLIGIDTSKHDSKSHIDMSDGIFFDDLQKNLEECNSPYPTIFGDEYSWNTPDKFHRTYNWIEAKNYVLSL